MAIKKFKPIPMSRRFQEVVDYKQEVTTDRPYKPLLEPKKRISGRNNSGRITVRHRGGGSIFGLIDEGSVSLIPCPQNSTFTNVK